MYTRCRQWPSPLASQLGNSLDKPASHQECPTIELTSDALTDRQQSFQEGSIAFGLPNFRLKEQIIYLFFARVVFSFSFVRLVCLSLCVSYFSNEKPRNKKLTEVRSCFERVLDWLLLQHKQLRVTLHKHSLIKLFCPWRFYSKELWRYIRIILPDIFCFAGFYSVVLLVFHRNFRNKESISRRKCIYSFFSTEENVLKKISNTIWNINPNQKSKSLDKKTKHWK